MVNNLLAIPPFRGDRPRYPKLKKEKKMPAGIQIRQVKCLINIIEQNHRFIKKRIRLMLGLKSFQTAKRILAGLEAMRMIKQEQTFQGEKSVKKPIMLIQQLYNLTV